MLKFNGTMMSHSWAFFFFSFFFVSPQHVVPWGFIVVTRLTTVFFFLVCVFLRRLRPVGRCSHREPTREIPVRPGGVREEPVPEPAQPLWEAPAAAALSAHRLIVGNRAAVFRPLGR